MYKVVIVGICEINKYVFIDCWRFYSVKKIGCLDVIILYVVGLEFETSCLASKLFPLIILLHVLMLSDKALHPFSVALLGLIWSRTK